MHAFVVAMLFGFVKADAIIIVLSAVSFETIIELDDLPSLQNPRARSKLILRVH